MIFIPFKSQLATIRAKISTNLNLGFFPVQGEFTDTTITLRKQAIYLITDITFSTNAKEDDFVEGLSDPANANDPGTEILARIKRVLKGGDSVNRYPFRFTLYKRNWPAQVYFQTTTERDQLKVQVEGTIRQTAGMVADGINRLDCFFNFSLYEMEERSFIARFNNDP
jgi:hypothetical protein